MPAPKKPKPKPKTRTTAQKLANPNWRATLPDSALTPAQRAQRTRNKALKADPLAPVTTLRDLEGQAGTLVDTQQADEKANIAQDQARADAEFRTRSGMYQGMANYQTQGYQNAFNSTRDAINAVMAATNAGNSADQGNLAAALRAADAEQAKAYAAAGAAPLQNGQLPGQVPQDSTAERLAALAGTGEGVRQQVGQAGAAQVGAAGAMQAIPGQQLAISMQTLQGERNKTNEELAGKRTTLAQNRKGLLRQAVRDLQDFEVAKRQYGDQHANMLFQQYIAQKEFDQKVQQESFAEWLQTSQLTGTTAAGGPVDAQGNPLVAPGSSTIPGRAQDTADRVAGADITGRDPVTGQPTVAQKTLDAQIAVDWANVHINQTQANAAYQTALNDAKNAKTADQRERGKNRAAAIAKGITALDSYLAPNEGEGAPPSATGRYPVGTSTAIRDKNGNAVTHKASQAEADAYNKAHQNTGNPPMAPGDPVPTAGRPYVRRFAGALAHLKSQGLSHSMALRVLSMSSYTDWAKRANEALASIKRRAKHGPARPKTSRQKPGTSGAAGYGGPT